MGEMARLLAVDSQSILNDRYESGGQLCEAVWSYRSLQGISNLSPPAQRVPDQHHRNWLAEGGGSGDLLTVIAPRRPRGLHRKAAAAGVYYHGKAVDLRPELQTHTQPMDAT